VNQSSFLAINGNSIILTDQTNTLANGYGIYCTASEGVSVSGNTVKNQGVFTTTSNGVRFGADMIGSSIVGNVTKGMVSPVVILSGATNCMEVSNI
jgi:putative cofactor-binding repeat protein